MRRVFQAVRIAVNDEFSALESFLRNLPQCLKPGGRVAILTFHSGEDRRVKKSFEANHLDGLYADIAREVLRPTRGGAIFQPALVARKAALGRAGEVSHRSSIRASATAGSSLRGPSPFNRTSSSSSRRIKSKTSSRAYGPPAASQKCVRQPNGRSA